MCVIALYIQYFPPPESRREKIHRQYYSVGFGPTTFAILEQMAYS